MNYVISGVTCVFAAVSNAKQVNMSIPDPGRISLKFIHPLKSTCIVTGWLITATFVQKVLFKISFKARALLARIMVKAGLLNTAI